MDSVVSSHGSVHPVTWWTDEYATPIKSVEIKLMSYPDAKRVGRGVVIVVVCLFFVVFFFFFFLFVCFVCCCFFSILMRYVS